MQMRVSPVKQSALDAMAPVYQPQRVRDEKFIRTVREILPDAIVVAAFGQIIPKAILDVPRYGSINVHASLLPQYRGAAPVHHALFNGETRTGVTTMLMDPGLDTGPVLLQREVEVLPDDNEGALETRLAEEGAGLLVETLRGLEEGRIVPKPQDDALATYAPSVKRDECVVDWNRPAESIANHIRGCTPRPGAYSLWLGSPLKIWRARAAEEPDCAGEPGEIAEVDSEGIRVKAGRGSVVLLEVQPENRRRMPALEFARGYRAVKGAKLM
jgi:methionyl-tRNA formyltransferase